jgi:hypothetical protein
MMVMLRLYQNRKSFRQPSGLVRLAFYRYEHTNKGVVRLTSMDTLFPICTHAFVALPWSLHYVPIE